MEWLPHRLHIPSVAETHRLSFNTGVAVMKTFLIKAIAALGVVGLLAVASAAPSSAEPTYQGYPLHDWYTVDGW
jgi:hypothetical protein